MKRRYLYILLGLILVLLIGAGLLWKGVFAPGKKADTGTDRKPSVRKQIITSEDLIAKALKSGEIDYETSLLHRVYAIFADQRLPEKYLGNVINHDAGTSLFAEIFANKDRLSPDLLKKLAPYIARPNDPVSIFNQPGFTTASVLPVFAQVGTWKSLPAAGGLTRVWTRSDYKTALDLDTYVNEVNQVWPKLRELIRAPIPDEAGNPTKEINPDSAIDIYIVPLPGPDPRRPGSTLRGAGGWTSSFPPYKGRTSSAYIMINARAGRDLLVEYLAHELFHASQNSYDIYETAWLNESTASWGAFRVFQKLGRSTTTIHQKYELPEFFADLDYVPLDAIGGKYHEYGAYLYFLFAKMESSDAIVSKVWESATNENGAKAVNAVFEFKDHFREFALRNWNFEPVKKRYEQADHEFPSLGPPIAREITLSPDKKETLDKKVNRLTARYYSIKVPKKEGINKVKINLREITQNPDAGVDALLTIEGKDAEVRHWSGKSEEIFCLDDPDEKLRELVLIVSNASMENDLTGKIEIDPTKQCAEWSGTITLNSIERESYSYTLGKSGSKSYEKTIIFQASERLQLDLDREQSILFADSECRGDPDCEVYVYIDNKPVISGNASGGGKDLYRDDCKTRTSTWSYQLHGQRRDVDANRHTFLIIKRGNKWTYRLESVPGNLEPNMFEIRRTGNGEYKEIAKPGCGELAISNTWVINESAVTTSPYIGKDSKQKLSGGFDPKSGTIQGNANFQWSDKTISKETTITWSFRSHRRSSR